MHLSVARGTRRQCRFWIESILGSHVPASKVVNLCPVWRQDVERPSHWTATEAAPVTVALQHRCAKRRAGPGLLALSSRAVGTLHRLRWRARCAAEHRQVVQAHSAHRSRASSRASLWPSSAHGFGARPHGTQIAVSGPSPSPDRHVPRTAHDGHTATSHSRHVGHAVYSSLRSPQPSHRSANFTTTTDLRLHRMACRPARAWSAAPVRTPSPTCRSRTSPRNQPAAVGARA